ncbi:hypothetical protein [uncultured Tateyamaria sp.]|uniref:hypothetical protein n=1 Tax=uncultured Tateyamaria sp. TaxID=455651 RepID=UPI002622DB02|nr:hypothetical protein [uncultured Tateyamaria sp.]
MPLHILLILVVGGIAGIALALHLLGLSKASPFTTQTAHAAWLRAHPDDAIKDLQITQDGRTARITSGHGNGIIWQMGADTCARRLSGAERLQTKGTKTILHLNDYAAPKVRLTLSADEQQDWQNWITQT